MPETIFLAQGNSARARCRAEKFACGEPEEFEFSVNYGKIIKN
jgi:hypothetical protein